MSKTICSKVHSHMWAYNASELKLQHNLHIPVKGFVKIRNIYNSLKIMIGSCHFQKDRLFSLHCIFILCMLIG